MIKKIKGLPLKRKILLSIAVLGGMAAITGLGTYALFTSTTSVTQTALASGSLTLVTPSAGATNRLTLGATNLVPGDTMQRIVDLTNSGGAAMSAITLTTTASPSSLLDTDTTNGLQLAIDKCSNAWTESGSSPAFTYTCSGTTTSVLATRPVIGSAIALTNLASISGSATDRLRVTLTFPSVAGNTLQGQSSAVTYAFTGTQRASTNQ